MKKLRILLIIPMALLELLFLGLAWLLVAVGRRKNSEQVMQAAFRYLPSRDWYFGS